MFRKMFLIAPGYFSAATYCNFCCDTTEDDWNWFVDGGGICCYIPLMVWLKEGPEFWGPGQSSKSTLWRTVIGFFVFCVLKSV